MTQRSLLQYNFKATKVNLLICVLLIFVQLFVLKNVKAIYTTVARMQQWTLIFPLPVVSILPHLALLLFLSFFVDHL